MSSVRDASSFRATLLLLEGKIKKTGRMAYWSGKAHDLRYRAEHFGKRKTGFTLRLTGHTSATQLLVSALVPDSLKASILDFLGPSRWNIVCDSIQTGRLATKKV